MCATSHETQHNPRVHICIFFSSSSSCSLVCVSNVHFGLVYLLSTIRLCPLQTAISATTTVDIDLYSSPFRLFVLLLDTHVDHRATATTSSTTTKRERWASLICSPTQEADAVGQRRRSATCRTYNMSMLRAGNGDGGDCRGYSQKDNDYCMRVEAS